VYIDLLIKSSVRLRNGAQVDQIEYIFTLSL